MRNNNQIKISNLIFT